MHSDFAIDHEALCLVTDVQMLKPLFHYEMNDKSNAKFIWFSMCYYVF